MKYRCTICGYIYDNEKEKIKFEELPENWVCPLCGAPKSMFEMIEE
ncbi:MAG: rubredoxin [Bacilli bacterium]